MKKIILIGLIVFSAVAVKSQVVIGKSAVTNNSVSLEFATLTAEPRGLILPYVTDRTGITVNGTVIYNGNTNKVEYLKGGSWFDLTGATPTQGTISGTDIQTTRTEIATAKTGIGTLSASDSTPGILVLTDTDKAMVLPKVASPHLNIINPGSGMIAYDTVKRQLAVFNGTVWSFWKP